MTKPLRIAAVWVGIVIVSTIAVWTLAMLWAFGAFAQSGHHGDGHAENHDWYKDLVQQVRTRVPARSRTAAESMARASAPNLPRLGRSRLGNP